MKNGIVKQIRAIMNYYGLSQSELASRIGVRQPNLSAILSGDRACGDGVINKILLSFDINKSWLLTGEGEMLASNGAKEVQGSQTLQDEIPLIPASAFAGSVKGFAPDSITLQKCEWVKPPMQGAQYAIPITGDSMEPVFANGSIAYIRQINEAAFLPWGNAVILDTENGAFLKVIYPDEQDKEYIWAKSYNPNYPPLHIPTASVFRIFRVLGTSKIFTTM